MPNLVPPLTTASDAMAYKNRIQQLEPNLNILMTLYLHESITPAVVRGAKAQGIVGIKVYPAGVTTNSKSGVSSYEPFYPVFQGQCLYARSPHPPPLILFKSDGTMWNGSQPSRRMPFRSCEEHHDFERRIEVLRNLGRIAFYVPQGMYISFQTVS